MYRSMRRFALMMLVLLSGPASNALAHGCGGPKEDGTGCKHLGCWLWSCKEVEETVYDVTYQEVKKTIKVPYIKEMKETISCKVCKPFDSTSLRECPEIDYCRSADTVNIKKCITTQDECGNCHTETKCEPHIKTCLTRTEVTRQFPVLEWQLIPVEDKITKVYYVRDWKDEEVVLRVPVKTPRVITRKVWSRVPAPCNLVSSCETCDAPAEETPVEVQPDPAPEVTPDPVPAEPQGF